MFGLGLFNADGVCVYGTNTNLEEFQPTEIDGDGVVTFTIDKLDLVEGTYRLDLAAHKLTAIRTTTTACSTPSA